METRTRRYRGVLAYLLFVSVVIVAIVGWQRHTNHRFDQTDRETCRARAVLATNQQLVLTILHRNVTGLLRQAPIDQRAYWRRSHDLVQQAQERLSMVPACTP